MKYPTPELVRAITPMFLGTVGAVIGIGVLFSPSLTDAKWTAALGLAGTAIAGAAGLAQGSRSEPPGFSVEEQGGNVKVQTPPKEMPQPSAQAKVAEASSEIPILDE